MQVSHKNNTNNFYNLGEKCFNILCSYLSMAEKVKFAAVSKVIRMLLFKSYNWGAFQISDCTNQNWKVHIEWVAKYITIIQPKILQISIREHSDCQAFLKICLTPMSHVQQISLICESQYIHTALAVSCPNITVAIFRSEAFGDILFQIMQKYLVKLHTIKIIKDDWNFTFNRFKTITKMQSIVCKCHQLNFEKLVEIIKESSQTLTELQLDVEQCEEQALSQIVSSLHNIQRLRLYHCQNLKCSQLLASSLPQKMIQFCMTKAYDLTLTNILKKEKSIYLQELDLTESRLVTNQNIMILAKDSPNLKKVNLSWCLNITEQGIRYLIKNCHKLEYLNINGLKSITDEAFQQYFSLKADFIEGYFDKIKHEIQIGKQSVVNPQLFFKQNFDEFEKTTSLSNLKWLECISCNGLSDAILKIIYLRWRKVTAINYYGNSMGLYSSINDDIF